MRRVVWVKLIALVVLGTCTVPARGYFGRQVYPSVEAMVGYADSVVLGRVASVSAAARGKAVRFEVVVEPVETVKGVERREGVRVGVMDDAPWRQCLKGGGEVVLFLAQTGREGLFAAGDMGGLMVVDERVAFYNLTRRHERTFDLRMRRLFGREEIVAAVRAAGEFERSGKAVKMAAGVWPWVSLPLRARFGRDLETDRATELLLPLDERTEAVAEEWEKSGDPEWRLMAVRAAARVDTKRSRGVVERLLGDPAYVTEPMQGWDSRREWRRRRIYFVRQAAWEAMVARPRDGRVVLEGPDVGLYVWVGRWVWIGVVLGAAALVGAAVWAVRRWRSFGLGVAIVCVGLLVMIGVLWARSRGRMDAVSFATGRSEHEIVSQCGRLSWLRVHDEPGARGPAFRSESVTGNMRHVQWFSPWLSAGVWKEALGVIVSSGQTQTPGAGVAAYPYYLVILRYSLVMGVLAGWPVVSGGVVLVRGLRRRLWVAMGRCRGCGYDVRWGAGKCPECGVDSGYGDGVETRPASGAAKWGV